MIYKLNPVDFLAALKARVEESTGLPCHDNPKDKESPFYSFELLGIKPDNTKTMLVDVFSVRIHCIAAPSEGSEAVLDMVHGLFEAMTARLAFGCPAFRSVNQQCDGLRAVKTDESGEGHAVVDYSIGVCYRLRMK